MRTCESQVGKEIRNQEPPTLHELVVAELIEQHNDGEIMFCPGAVLPPAGDLDLPQPHFLVSPMQRIDDPVALAEFTKRFFATMEPDRHHMSRTEGKTIRAAAGYHTEQVVDLEEYTERSYRIGNMKRFKQWMQERSELMRGTMHSSFTSSPITETTVVHVLHGPEFIFLARAYMQLRKQGIEEHPVFEGLTRGIVPTRWDKSNEGSIQMAYEELEQLVVKSRFTLPQSS